MANENDVSVSLGMKFDGSSIQKTIDTAMNKVNSSINKSTKQIGDDISKNTKKGVDSAVKELSELDKKVQEILNDNSINEKFGNDAEKIRKSKAMKISALYQKDGMNQSDANKQGYSIYDKSIGRVGDSISKSMDKAQKKTNKFFDLFKKKANSAKKQASDVGNNLNVGIGGALKKLAALGASAFAVGKIVQFGKEALELGSNLSEVQNIVDSTFTTLSSKVDEYAKTSITRLGMSETSYKKMMGTMGAMSKSFGFSEEQALNMADSITALTADVASFYNLSHDEAYTKMKSIYTGETESLKDLGELYNAA